MAGFFAVVRGCGMEHVVLFGMYFALRLRSLSQCEKRTVPHLGALAPSVRNCSLFTNLNFESKYENYCNMLGDEEIYSRRGEKLLLIDIKVK